MAITASLVKELRERSGCGMMDCKNALVETDGDFLERMLQMEREVLSEIDPEALQNSDEDNKKKTVGREK